MNSFTSLPLVERQAKVNAVLKPATARLPKRIRRNAKVMGPIVKFVWTQLGTGFKLSQAEVIRQARTLETTPVVTTAVSE